VVGVELELLAKDAPEVFERLKNLPDGRVQLYNGTYAQPHLQVLSSGQPAPVRVRRPGLPEAGLDPVTVYAHQEASVHDQVPQLLTAFGYRFAVVPGFLSTLAWLEQGELVLHGVRGPRFVQGHEFAAWQGLDGTQIPLYLHQPVPREYTLKDTLVRIGLGSRVPPLLVDLPDMIAIDDAWMAERENVDFVLLEGTLEQRLGAPHHSAKARLYTHWSYLEASAESCLEEIGWRGAAAASHGPDGRYPGRKAIPFDRRALEDDPVCPAPRRLLLQRPSARQGSSAG
jgi:hypothetical protein